MTRPRKRSAPLALLAAALAVLTLSACARGPTEAEAATARAQASEAAAATLEQQFSAAFADGNWRLARGYGDMLQQEHPASGAARRIAPQLDEARARLEAETQARRLAALWAYGDQPVKRGHQLSAAIYSQEPVDTDGTGARPVRLIFRDHPEWGRSSYLVLERGDFDCYKGCRLKVTIDGKARTLPGTRPKTDEAIAMFIDDWKGLWKLAGSGRQLSIEFPTKAVGKRTAVFEVGGLDPARLAKWPQPATKPG